MKIAFCIINCNRREGSARPVNEIAERLALRHDAHIFARKVEDLDVSRIRVHYMPGLSWPDFVDFTSYHALADIRIRRGDFDIVHSIGVNAAAANVITIQNIQPAKRKFMTQAMREEKTSIARKLAKWIYLEITTAMERRMYTQRPNRRAPLFLPVSRGVENELRAFYDIGNAPVKIVPNAADTNVFKPISTEARTAWRVTNGFAEQDLVMIFSGGEWARKGLDLALHALALIQNSAVKLFVAGDDPDRRRYLDLALQLQLRDRVIFGGFRKDIATAMASSDLFLFPSWYEAFSLATIEAAACGLPIIATRINGTEDFIQPVETGEFIEHCPDQIASILKPILNDRANCRRMGDNARRLVESSYTWDRVADLTENAYREYLSFSFASMFKPSPP